MGRTGIHVVWELPPWCRYVAVEHAISEHVLHCAGVAYVHKGWVTMAAVRDYGARAGYVFAQSFNKSQSGQFTFSLVLATIIVWIILSRKTV